MYTHHACALCLIEMSTAEQRVDMREAEVWKSRVNAITWPVQSRSDRLEQAVLICNVFNAC